VTNQPIAAPPKERPAAPAPNDTAVRPEGYRWKHSLHPEEPGQPFDPEGILGVTVDGKYRIQELLGRGAAAWAPCSARRTRESARASRSRS
jgi:hypothetical protein